MDNQLPEHIYWHMVFSMFLIVHSCRSKNVLNLHPQIRSIYKQIIHMYYYQIILYISDA